MLALQKVQPGSVIKMGTVKLQGSPRPGKQDESSLLPIMPGLADRGCGLWPATDSKQPAKRG